MTVAELGRFGRAREQLELLNAEIEALEDKRRALYTSDTVQGSAEEYPYTLHTVSVHGIAARDARTYKQLDGMLRAAIERRKTLMDAYVAEYSALDSFILGLGDPPLQRLVNYKYVQGMTNTEIAREMGDGWTADSVRMRLNRFAEKLQGGD